jgi:hypothetical protein
MTRLIKFCTVGVWNTAVDFLVFWTAAEWIGLSVYTAQVMAYCIATCKQLPFKQQLDLRQRQTLFLAAIF